MSIQLEQLKTDIETGIKADGSISDLQLELYNGNNVPSVSGLLDVFLVAFPPESISGFKLSATPECASAGIAFWETNKTSSIYTCATNLYKKIDDTALNWATIISQKVINIIAEKTAKTIAEKIITELTTNAEIYNIKTNVSSLDPLGLTAGATPVTGSLTNPLTASQNGTGKIE
jgi:hypothetical protein